MSELLQIMTGFIYSEYMDLKYYLKDLIKQYRKKKQQ